MKSGTRKLSKEAKIKTKTHGISKACIGKNKTSGGYIWRYNKEESSN